MNKGSPEEADHAIKKHRLDTGGLSSLPGPRVSVLFSTVNILMLLGLRYSKTQQRESLWYHGTLLWVHPQGWRMMLCMR
jgi:hypothetical protein